MRGPLVFTANDVNLDLSSLDEWGKIVSVFSSHLYPDTTDEMARYAEEGKERMKLFDPLCDAIAMVGDPVLTSLIIACVVKSGIHKFTVLKFDRRLKAYYPAVINIGE